MFEYTHRVIMEAERLAQDKDLEATLQILRSLPLADFGELLFSMPLENFPNLSEILPRMASVEVQNSWTGSNGMPLLTQTLSFVRSLDYAYARIAGECLRGKRILDFGCGYGRIVRLMYYYTSPSNIYGVDPWDLSINLCNEARLRGTFSQSDYLPASLPLSDTTFDLIYAFSVFTHLSPRAMNACLGTLRRYMAPNGLLAVTIRPVEYWRAVHGSEVVPDSQPLIVAHRQKGFAFNPHPRPQVDGDVTYGDASMTLEYLQDNCPGWRVVNYDRSLDDIYQMIVFMQPAIAAECDSPRSMYT
jgi:SAM-dependent methyltransferase